MNGAVAGSMRYYGADYGLNYGVSLPTIRSLADAEGRDHQYAKYLFQQQVREIQLASLHVAEPGEITAEELDFWAKGIINSEVAEEAAFALFQYVGLSNVWLESDNELLIYVALLSLAKSRRVPFEQIASRIAALIGRNSLIITNASITLLESYYREIDNSRVSITQLLTDLPDEKSANYVKSEMEWRCELL